MSCNYGGSRASIDVAAGAPVGALTTGQTLSGAVSDAIAKKRETPAYQAYLRGEPAKRADNLSGRANKKAPPCVGTGQISMRFEPRVVPAVNYREFGSVDLFAGHLPGLLEFFHMLANPGQQVVVGAAMIFQESDQKPVRALCVDLQPEAVQTQENVSGKERDAFVSTHETSPRMVCRYAASPTGTISRPDGKRTIEKTFHVR